MLQFLLALQKCDPVFRDVLALPAGKAPCPVLLDESVVREIFEQGRNREDAPPRAVIEKLGYTATFTSKVRTQEDKWLIRCACGLFAGTPNLLNRCVLSLPKTPQVLSRILRIEPALALIRAMISAWDPDWAVYQSSDFLKQFTSDAAIPGKALVGWMTYFASRVGEMPSLAGLAAAVQRESGGSIMISTEEPLDSARPEHLATADSIVRALQRCGLIPSN